MKLVPSDAVFDVGGGQATHTIGGATCPGPPGPSGTGVVAECDGVDAELEVPPDVASGGRVDGPSVQETARSDVASSTAQKVANAPARSAIRVFGEVRRHHTAVRLRLASSDCRMIIDRSGRS